MASVIERRHWLRMLFVLAASDGRVANREKKVIQGACQAWGLSDRDYDWAESQVLASGDTSIYQPVNHEGRGILFDALVKLAAADGHIDDQEFVLVEHYADKLGVSESRLQALLNQRLAERKSGCKLDLPITVKAKPPGQAKEALFRKLRDETDFHVLWYVDLLKLVFKNSPPAPAQLAQIEAYSQAWGILPKDALLLRRQVEKSVMIFGPLFEFDKSELEEFYEALIHVASLNSKVNFEQLQFIVNCVKDLKLSRQQIVSRVLAKGEELHGEGQFDLPMNAVAELERAEAERLEKLRANAALFYGVRHESSAEKLSKSFWKFVAILVVLVKVVLLIRIVASL